MVERARKARRGPVFPVPLHTRLLRPQSDHASADAARYSYRRKGEAGDQKGTARVPLP